MPSERAARPTPLPTPAEDLVAALEAMRMEAAAARAAAAATTAQLQAMQALTDTAFSHLALDDLLRELLGRVTAVMGVDAVAILLLEEDGRTLTLRAVCGLGEEDVGRVQFEVGWGFAGRVAASRAPQIMDADALSADDFEGAHPILRERLRSFAGVPLLVEGQGAEGRLVGMLAMGSTTPRRFSEADVQLLQCAADRVAMAIDRARLYAAEQDARQRAEAARVQAERQADQLDRIFEAAADGLTVWDAAGRLVRENAAARRILALDAAPPGFEQLPVRERLARHAPHDEQDHPLALEEWPNMRALRGEVVTGPEVRDVRMRALDGREIELTMSAAPLRDREGHIVGAVCVMHDQTERNRLERERAAARADELAAREVSRRMEAFSAVAAHDLRSPLTATVGFLALAARQTDQLASAAQAASPTLAPQVAAVRGRLEDVHQSAARLTRLLTLLFDTSAIRAGKLELRRAPCDLAALVREQVTALRAAAPDRAITLHAPVDGAPIPVEADADRLGQVLTNYVTNALKYSPPDRPVDVSVAVRAGQARVAVRDAGPGIQKEERARVWELFHRAPG